MTALIQTQTAPPSPAVFAIGAIRVRTPAETGPAQDPTIRRLVAANTLDDACAQALLQHARIRSRKKGEIIHRWDDPVTSVVLVLDGYLKLATPLANGDDLFVDLIGPGAYDGDIAALQGRTHDMTAKALTACRLLVIDARHFRHVIVRRPEAMLAFIRLAGQRLHRITEQLADNRTLPAPARLAKALIFLTGLAPSSTPVRLSQEDLGALSGVGREFVNKNLSAWRDTGLVKMENGSVTSIDRGGLSRLMEASLDRGG